MKSDLEIGGAELTVLMEKGLVCPWTPASRTLAMNTLAAVCHSRFPNRLLLIGRSLFYPDFGGQRGRKAENNLVFCFLPKFRLSGGFK